MQKNPLSGKPAPRELLANVPRLVSDYYVLRPDPREAAEQVAFGTSGHRGSSSVRTFNEAHILASSQAVAEYRRSKGISGPLYVGIDTHALSEPAFVTAVEVFAANDVAVFYQTGRTPTPTPVVSHAILAFNKGRTGGFADGIVITPSHNPPEDGGFKYNPPHGGPADTDATSVIQKRANSLLASDNREVRRVPFERAISSGSATAFDFIAPYVGDLRNVVDLESIRGARVKMGVDPMGGATVGFWDPISTEYGLDVDVVNRVVDPTFSFMTVDYDGKIRMDCSSVDAMQRLIGLAARYDVAFGNDPDGDRHGIVTRSAGLMNPNHYLAVAIGYLFQNRPGWSGRAAVGKTVVSSSILDRVAASMGRELVEVPVGFKWFVPGLFDGTLGFGGEESAGASFLRRDGGVWTTDKDGLILDLLAAEILAKTGKDPAEHYKELTARFGAPVYERTDAPANAAQKKALGELSEADVRTDTLAGEKIVAKLSRAPGNDQPIGGLKVVAESGWFAARPSGTEAVYKIYAESFRGADHLARIREEARALVDRALSEKSGG